MKFLFLTDTHIRKTPPDNRTDNYHQTLLNKLNEIVKISKQENVDYVLHGGDWYDRPSHDKQLSDEISDIVKSIDKPVYTIFGNHDFLGTNPESIEGTMLGALIKEGIVKLLKDNQNIFLSENSIVVQLSGRSYRYGIDSEENKESYFISKDKKADYAINMVHGMLLYKPFPADGIKFTLINEICNTSADITLSGHYHSGYGIINMNNRYFINPGSIVRITNYRSELSRIPKIIIIEIKNNVKIRQIELKSALPGAMVLDEHKLIYD